MDRQEKLEKKKKHYRDRREHYKAYNKRRYAENKEAILLANRTRPSYKRRLDKLKENYRTIEGAAKALHNLAQTNSKRKGIEFNLTVDWYVEHLKPLLCEATGISLTLDVDDSKLMNAFRPSTDRVDNSKGYTKDNCRIVCVMFNRAKGRDTDYDVWKMCSAFVKKNAPSSI